MLARLQLHLFDGVEEVVGLAHGEISSVSHQSQGFSPRTHPTLYRCLAYMQQAGASSIVVQRRVLDPDFLAEYNAYYSRQFRHVDRHCIRLHFFKVPLDGSDVLSFLDREDVQQSYLGFLTLRPVTRTPVGASIFADSAVDGFVKCTDTFPVRLAGVDLEVKGTPFMQQDNAVGACAQASIWMALRTLRRRDGDRAYDPAQISDAATRYWINGRKLPNREGLTQFQMTEAVRAAGYSPHCIRFGDGSPQLSEAAMNIAVIQLHAYLESEIPVLLTLFPAPNAGHAVTLVGHSWSETLSRSIDVALPSIAGFTLQHACCWVPAFLIHNDNSGPYLTLESNKGNYQLEHLHSAIPLLPVDVFMTGEEAHTLSLDILAAALAALGGDRALEQSGRLAIRLLLLDKRKIRRWAAATKMPQPLREWLRTADLPRRVWALEIHLSDRYGGHGSSSVESMVGLILLDSTSDAEEGSMLLNYLDYILLFGAEQSALVTQDANATEIVPVTESGAMLAILDGQPRNN